MTSNTPSRPLYPVDGPPPKCPACGCCACDGCVNQENAKTVCEEHSCTCSMWVPWEIPK